MATHTIPGAFPTIQAGLDSVPPGDILLITPGVYEEILTVNTENITIIAANPNQAIIRGTCENTGITVNESGFVLENMNVEKFEVGLYLEAPNATINGCIFTENTRSAITTYRNGHNIINNQFYDNNIGIDNNSIATNITSNVFINNPFYAIINSQDSITTLVAKYNNITNSETGIKIGNESTSICTITSNIINKCEKGIVIDAMTNIIEKNTISYCSIFGINILGSDNTIQYNAISNNTQGVIITGTSNTLQYNTITQNTNIGLTVLGDPSPSEVNNANNNIIINNIFGVSQLPNSSIANYNCVSNNKCGNIIPSNCAITSQSCVNCSNPQLYIQKFIPNPNECYSNNCNCCSYCNL